MKSDIVIGEGVKLNLDALLRSRLLIQANSGGGKSWCIRRIAEQAFGKLPIVIIDPEGEFATLRERFGFVLVGKGGETPADVRSAGLVAHRLLELRASAVCDIFELSPFNRHLWVKTFLQAMIDAPKELWNPTLVVVDEAHTFAPEKGAGESDASEAMISLATKGRKRGFCAVFATQRISKLRKDAAAELHNNIIGKCFIDNDRKRAAEQLGIQSRDFHEFSEKMKLMPQGVFLAQGVAISTEIVEFKVGAVSTTHPDINTKQATLAAPPAPAEIKHLLPKLADLPKAAEEKAKTEADLRGEIRSLKAQLAARPKVEVDEAATGKAVERAVALRDRERDAETRTLRAAIQKLEHGLSAIGKVVTQLTNIELPEPKPRAQPIHVQQPRPVSRPVRATLPPESSNGYSAAHVRILSRLVELLDCTGADSVRKEQLAAWAEYSPNSGGFNNYLGFLRSSGLIEYPTGGHVAITDEGRKHARPEDVPTDSGEMLERAKRVLGGSEARIFEHVFMQRDEPISKVQLAEATGFSANSGGFNNYLGHMRTLGFIDYPQRGMVQCSDWMFLGEN